MLRIWELKFFPEIVTGMRQVCSGRERSLLIRHVSLEVQVRVIRRVKPWCEFSYRGLLQNGLLGGWLDAETFSRGKRKTG